MIRTRRSTQLQEDGASFVSVLDVRQKMNKAIKSACVAVIAIPCIWIGVALPYFPMFIFDRFTGGSESDLLTLLTFFVFPFVFFIIIGAFTILMYRRTKRIFDIGFAAVAFVALGSLISVSFTFLLGGFGGIFR